MKSVNIQYRSVSVYHFPVRRLGLRVLPAGTYVRRLRTSICQDNTNDPEVAVMYAIYRDITRSEAELTKITMLDLDDLIQKILSGRGE